MVVVGDRLDDAVGQTPQPQQLAPDLGVGHPALLLLDLEQRTVLAAGALEHHGQVVALLGGEHEQPDVVQQGRDEGVVALLADRHELARDAGDLRAVALQRVEVEALDRRRGLERLEGMGRQHERAQGAQAQQDGRLPDVGDLPAQAEEGRVDHLQHLRRHGEVLRDDGGRVARGGAAVGQQRGELAVQARRRRQAAGRDGLMAGLALGGDRAQGARARDDAHELVHVAGLAQEAMRDRRCPHDDLALGGAREDDPDHRRVGLLDVAQQRRRRPCPACACPRRRRRTARGRARPGVGAAGGEEHLPLVALRAQRVAQAVEHLRLVVDEEDPRHAATCVSRGC